MMAAVVGLRGALLLSAILGISSSQGLQLQTPVIKRRFTLRLPKTSPPKIMVQKASAIHNRHHFFITSSTWPYVTHPRIYLSEIPPLPKSQKPAVDMICPYGFLDVATPKSSKRFNDKLFVTLDFFRKGVAGTPGWGTTLRSQVSSEIPNNRSSPVRVCRKGSLREIGR